MIGENIGFDYAQPAYTDIWAYWRLLLNNLGLQYSHKEREEYKTNAPLFFV